MSDGLRWTGFLCVIVLLTGCFESKTSGDPRGFYGSFNNVKMEVESLKLTIDNDNWYGQNNPVEDQVQSSIKALMINDDVVGTPIEAEAKKLYELEAKMHQVYRSPDATKEKMQEVADEMWAIVQKIEPMVFD